MRHFKCQDNERPCSFRHPNRHGHNQRSALLGRADIKLVLLLSFIAFVGASCGTVPGALALIHSSSCYSDPPQFLAAQGPLSTAQDKEIVAQLERQTGKTDILVRHLAFDRQSAAPH